MNTPNSAPETKNHSILGLCLAGGLVFGTILGLISGSPVLSAGSGLVLGLPIGLALEKQRSGKVDRSE